MMHKLLKTVAGVSLFTAVSTAALAADNANDESLQSLIDAAKKEGVVYSLGMPDPWANWVETWNDIKTNYGIEHFDTDMSSAQEIAKFEAEKNNASGDIGDIGEAFTSIAVKKGVTIPYKPTTWDSIPNWAKDKDGHWVIAYTGTISFLINKEIVKNPPKSWADLLEGDYKITVGDVGIAAQANNAILAAAIGLGGSEKDLKPALDFFGKLAKQDRLIFTDPSLANIEKGEIEVALLWDFNSLGYATKVGREKFEINIPQEGSVRAGYATIINKYAKHPNAAKLAREFILSDKGQINLAKGFARPVRDVKLPPEVESLLIPIEQYKNVRSIADQKAWDKNSKKLPRLWQEYVLIHQK